MKKAKKVYIGMTADILHHGHMNLLEAARKYGDIIIGLFTDAAVAEYKRLPYLNYKQREKESKSHFSPLIIFLITDLPLADNSMPPTR